MLPPSTDGWRKVRRHVFEGVHTVFYCEDADAARAFFRDVLRVRSLDPGDGWLFFALPPTQAAMHPGPG